MYLTAQHVRARSGENDVQAYLHFHDLAGHAFPSDPLTVPQQHPGRTVRSRRQLPLGGNNVLSYLDIVVPDSAWSESVSESAGDSTEWWHRRLEPLVELMKGTELPWVIEAGDVHVIFNASPDLATASEYETLLRAALALWEEWRVAENLR